MGIGDDLARGSLAEDLGQTHDRHGARGNDISQHLARSDRWQLIDITDEQQCGPLSQSPQQGSHQRHVDHRGLVDDQQITYCRLTQAPERFALLGRDVSQLSDDQLRYVVAERAAFFATRR